MREIIIGFGLSGKTPANKLLARKEGKIIFGLYIWIPVKTAVTEQAN